MRLTRRSMLVASAALIAAPAVRAQGAIKLRLGHPHPDVDPVQKAALRMAELVKERTKGAVEIQVFANGVLGSDPTMISGVRGGTLDMCWTGNPFFTGMAPKLNVLDLPFLFNDRDHVARVLDGSIWEVGWRNITNNRRPVRTPNDVRGLKIRTTPNPAHIKAFQLLGASPTPMAFTELYTAMEMGSVDGEENPVTLILNAKFNEVQKHLSLTQHAFTTAPLVMNKARFDGLAADAQSVLLAAAKEMAVYQRKLNAETEASSIAELKKSGMQVIEQLDREPFRKIVYEDVKKDFVDKYGSELVDQIAAAATA